MNKFGKIGIFDSGIGGVTVFQEILKILPYEEYLYYSDSKNNPYGDKSDEEIFEICDNIIKFLLGNDCKAIVIACNTASCKASNKLREKFKDVPIIAIEPAYKMVYDNNFDEKTLVLATKGTVNSKNFKDLILKYDNHHTTVLECSGLAELIENDKKDLIKKYLEENIKPYKGVKNVVLGCTHYPIIIEEFKQVLGNVNFYEGSRGVTNKLKETILKLGLKKGSGSITFFDSGKNPNKEKRFWKLLNK